MRCSIEFLNPDAAPGAHRRLADWHIYQLYVACLFVFVRVTTMRVLEQLANGVAVELVDLAVKVIVDGHRAEAPPAIIPRLPGGCISRASEQWKSRWCARRPCSVRGPTHGVNAPRLVRL